MNPGPEKTAQSRSGSYNGVQLDALLLAVLAAVFCLHYHNNTFIFQGDVFFNLYMHGNPGIFDIGWDPHAWGYLGWYPVYGALFPLNVPMHLILKIPGLDTPYVTLKLLQLTAWCSVFLLAFFTYLFFRFLGATRQGALLGAIVTAFTGFHAHTSVREFDLFYLHSFMPVPLALIFLIKANREVSIKWALAAGAMVGLSILGGINVPMFFVVPFFFVVFLVDGLPAAGQVRVVISRAVFYASITLGVGFLMGSRVILPSLKYMELSSRSGIVKEDVFATPPITYTAYELLFRWDIRHYTSEYDAFIGPLVLTLALLGLVFALLRTRSEKELGKGVGLKGALFFALMGAVSLVMMHSYYFPEAIKPTVSWLFSKMSIRYPFRYSMVLIFVAGFFVARGFDSLRVYYRTGAKRVVFLLVSGVMTALYVYVTISLLKGPGMDGLVRPLSVAVFIAAVFYLSLLVFHYLNMRDPDSTASRYAGFSLVLLVFFFYVFSRPDTPAREPDHLTFARLHPMSVDDSIRHYYKKPIETLGPFIEKGKNPMRVLNFAFMLRPNIWAAGEDVDIAFEPVNDPATMRSLQRYYETFDYKNPYSDPSSPLLDLYNVGLLAYTSAVKKDDGSKDWVTSIEYVNSNAFERFFTVHDVRFFDSDEELFTGLRSASREELSAKVFLVSDELNRPRTTGMGTDAREEVEIIERGPGRIVVGVDMKRAGHMVASELWFPAWKVMVDGREAELLKAYGTFWAVALEEGAHKIEFSFKDRYTFLGKLITLVCTGMVVVIFFGWKRSGPGSSE